ncbi:MAG: 30S ribosomal protein S4 [Candidatus Cloacimonetes bacterium]|nr:30S ribosomal protein S4 [Candidatus Cloacimonadota bacterium]
MARYTGSKAKLCRRFGENIFETPKYDKILEKRKYPPGDHGQKFRRKISDYGIHLREKQKLRFMYGLMEKQFRLYFSKADKMKGVTGENLLQLLERRLDNVVFRMGFAVTRPQARQFVNHGHITVNGRKVDIPSFLVKEGDVIKVRAKSRTMKQIQEAVDITSPACDWIEVDKEKLEGTFTRIPLREQIPVNVDERLIVEFYSQ